MHSSHDHAAATKAFGGDNGSHSGLLREAEFAVASAISVREQQKVQLLAMVSTLSPSPQGSDLAARQRSTPLRRGQVNPSPSLHVLGDMLLLLRAASVNVVERVQAWRQHLHQGRPQPYFHSNQNYLLVMCEDTDFLDRVDVLMEWLGFPLRRNPFITRDRLDRRDDRPPSRPETHEGNDNSRLRLTRLPAVHTGRSNNAAARSTSAHTRNKRPQPPASLVLPLASILPCDNAVDGKRVSAAQLVLLEEESLHGKLSMLRTARHCIESCQRLTLAVGNPDEQDRISGNNELSIYDQLAAVGARIRRNEKAVTRVRQARIDASRVLTELDDQIRWIESYRQEDREKDHIWCCRNRYRHDAVKLCAGLRASMQKALAQLDQNLEQLRTVVVEQQQLSGTLALKKERRLHARKLLQQQQREPMKSVLVKQPVHRKRPSQAPSSLKPMKRSGRAEAPTGPPSSSRLHPQLETSVAATLHEHNTQAVHNLERKRAAALEGRAVCLREKAKHDERARAELDRRRAESVLMKAEDGASRELQRLMETRRQLKQRRALFERISATAIFKCTHEMSGKTFLISVYEQKPRGYILEGIRVAAYDPITSSTFSLVLTLRQFDSYGYGRSRDGLRAFCKWLCLLYEKRKRRFRLVWVGAPCPPPLRVRDYDRTLVCAHKEGVKLSDQTGFALVAVYVRSDAPDLLRFVCSSLRSGTEPLMERSIRARDLFAPEDLELADEDTAGGIDCMAWRRHHRSLTTRLAGRGGDHGSENFFSSVSAGWNERHHVYSGTMVVDGARLDAHVYDVNSTEYIIDVGYFSKSSAYTSTGSPADGTEVSSSTAEKSPLPHHHRRVVLLKQKVSPYPLELPAESFGDLLACVTIKPANNEAGMRCGDDNTGAALTTWNAIVSRKWEEKLAKYVRVLRLTRFGCKIAGMFCFVTMYLVQLKTEYRARLLLELTPMCASNRDSSSVVKQSLYVSLSDYLRCGAATRRLGLTDGMKTTDECQVCAGKQPVDQLEPYHQLHRGHDAQQQHIREPTSASMDNSATSDTPTSCPGCVAAQTTRVGALRDMLAPLLLGEHVVWPQECVDLMAQVVHREHCDACGAALPSLLVIVGQEFLSHRVGLDQSLERYYLRCFDYRELVSSAVLHSDNELGIQFEASVADGFKQSVSHSRATVLLNADFGLTVAGANAFAYELHALLYPDAPELPFQTLYVMKRGVTIEPSFHTQHERRDLGVVAAVAAMKEAASLISESPSVHMGDTTEASDSGLGFDAYLVSEALLIEAVRVVLEPHLAWKKPGGTIGSSSWPVACELLRNIKYLSHELQLRDVLRYSSATQNVLKAYFSHESWPRSYNDVRPIFHMISAFMMHVEHVYHLIADSGGLLASINGYDQSSSLVADHSDEITKWHLHPQTSVLLL